MHRYKLTIEYDGTRYRGWQVQQNARTIQGEILAAARQFMGENADVQGAGRTDAGVHALAQVAHLESDNELEPFRVLFGLNDRLPADINVLTVEKAHPRFHARHHATGRSYVYLLSVRRTAFGRRYVWWIKDRLNLASMQQTASLFRGMHDFASFADKQVDKGKSMECLIEEVEMVQDGELILFRVAGSHFLWKMVRRMVGVLVEVGRANLSAGDVTQMLEARSVRPAELTAPPSGLFLQQVRYPGEAWQPLSVPAFPLATATHDS